jgi:hypothetical protein
MRPCMAAGGVTKMAESTAVARQAAGTKRCSKCLRVLPLDRFSPRSGMRDRRRPDCKDCNAMAKRQRIRRAAGLPV